MAKRYKARESELIVEAMKFDPDNLVGAQVFAGTALRLTPGIGTRVWKHGHGNVNPGDWLVMFSGDLGLTVYNDADFHRAFEEE